MAKHVKTVDGKDYYGDEEFINEVINDEREIMGDAMDEVHDLEDTNKELESRNKYMQNEIDYLRGKVEIIRDICRSREVFKGHAPSKQLITKFIMNIVKKILL